ncbi:MAG: SRPBCC family protein [Terriglobia bacterium]
MSGSKFIYVIYIRTTPEKLWDALTQPEFTRAYWSGCWHDTSWEQGSSWKLTIPDGRVGDSGQVVEIDKPKRFVLTWQNQFLPEMRAEGYSRCLFELEPKGDMVKLTITHEIDKPQSKLIEGVAGGWPIILSSLKSLLETGDSLEATKHWPEGL